jgi:hypothetical protein
MATDGSPRREQDVRKKLNAMDYWNAAFRGLSPGGWQQNPPVATDAGDVPPFSEDVEDYVPADPAVPIQQNIAPVPVVLVEDLSHTRKRVERFITTLSFNITVTPGLVVPRNPFRTQTIINNTTDVAVYLGHNDSVLTGLTTTSKGGFAVSPNSVVVLGTTREIWVVAITAPAVGTNTISVIQEYDKDTVED